jgi:hypothetical protein
MRRNSASEIPSSLSPRDRHSQTSDLARLPRVLRSARRGADKTCSRGGIRQLVLARALGRIRLSCSLSRRMAGQSEFGVLAVSEHQSDGLHRARSHHGHPPPHQQFDGYASSRVGLSEADVVQQRKARKADSRFLCRTSSRVSETRGWIRSPGTLAEFSTGTSGIALFSDLEFRVMGASTSTTKDLTRRWSQPRAVALPSSV